MSDLPPFDEKVVADQIDENGHMNIRHYFDFGAWAVWKATIATGFDEAYLRDRGMSFFTVEHHIRYFGELRLDERFTVHERLLARSSRALHGMAFVLDRERSRLASTLELVYVHVDMAKRKAVDIPDDVAAALDTRIAEGEQLGWAAPVCGVMGVHR